MSDQQGQRLSFGTMLRFGVGQAGSQVFRDTPAVLMPVFMATMLGVPPWLAGVVVLVAKLWVILCDPLVGLLSDKARPTKGRTPFLFAGGIASGVAFLALFAIMDYPSPWVAAAVVCLIYLVGITGFSAFSVPYLALSSELSGDPHERTKLLAFRVVFASVGVILGVGFAQPIIRHFGDGAHGWHMMAILFAAFITVTMLTTAIGLRKTPLVDAGEASIGLKEQFAAASRNRPFLILTGIHFIQSISQACTYTAVGLVFIYIVKDVGFLPAFTFTMCIFGVLSQPFWVGVSRRLGKMKMFIFASLGYVAITASWFTLGRHGNEMVVVPLYGEIRLEFVMILIRAIACGALNQGFLVLIMSMFTDTVEHGRIVNGADNAGGLAGFWSASEKLAFAMGPFIGGIILSASGFVASKGGIIAQGDAALRGIVLLFSLVPAGIFLLSLPLLLLYKPALKA